MPEFENNPSTPQVPSPQAKENNQNSKSPKSNMRSRWKKSHNNQNAQQPAKPSSLGEIAVEPVAKAQTPSTPVDQAPADISFPRKEVTPEPVKENTYQPREYQRNNRSEFNNNRQRNFRNDYNRPDRNRHPIPQEKAKLSLHASLPGYNNMPKEPSILGKIKHFFVSLFTKKTASSSQKPRNNQFQPRERREYGQRSYNNRYKSPRSRNQHFQK